MNLLTIPALHQVATLAHTTSSQAGALAMHAANLMFLLPAVLVGLAFFFRKSAVVMLVEMVAYVMQWSQIMRMAAAFPLLPPLPHDHALWPQHGMFLVQYFNAQNAIGIYDALLETLACLAIFVAASFFSPLDPGKWIKLLRAVTQRAKAASLPKDSPTATTPTP